MRWFPAAEELRGTAYEKLLPPLVAKVREEVKIWRDGNYAGTSATSRALLAWWFETDHLIEQADGTQTWFCYYFAQREAVETVIWLYDVRRARDKFDLLRFDASGAVSSNLFDEDWPRFVVKMATGAGKTKVLSLLMAWSYFHKLYEAGSELARNFLLIAPNIIVLDRLRADFDGLRIFFNDPVLPDNGNAGRNWRDDFQIGLHIQDNVRIVHPTGNIFLTNIHRVYLGDVPEPSLDDDDLRDYFLSPFGAKPVGKTTDSNIDLGEVVREIDELAVFNDEAHHIHDPRMTWFQCIQDIHHRLLQKDLRLALQIDVTATPRANDGSIFVQTVSDYPLVEAIAQGVVKHPVLPDGASRARLDEHKSPLITEKYADYLQLGVEEWRKSYAEHEKLGKKAVLFVMVDDTRNCEDVGEHLQKICPELQDAVLVIHTKANGEISPDDVYETVAARLGDQHPLLTRAVLVRRLFDVLEGESQAELADLLGTNPLDYFFTFVDTIVKREASEKWLARVSGDVMEPLLLQNEHHQLLSQIALEMWQLSTTSLRYEVLDVVVDIFCEGRKKRGAALRQIKERIKQHSLLSTDTSDGQGIGFDHEDFQNFYLGEGLGMILGKKRSIEIRAFFSANIVPTATIEQAVQYLIRHEAHLRDVMTTVMTINQSEANYSFCKENCGSLVIRLAEFVQDDRKALHLSNMFFPTGVLAGRTLKHVHFDNCYFQPTHLLSSSFGDIVFKDSEFERLEVDDQVALTGCTFVGCRIASLLFGAEEHIYEPALIAERLQKLDVMVEDVGSVSRSRAPDDRIKLLERFFRAFLRQTHLDEEIIRLRLGNKFSSTFFDHILPLLLSKGVLEEAPWRGKGIQRRFKLIRGMSEIETALEESHGDFDKFFDEFRPQ